MKTLKTATALVLLAAMLGSCSEHLDPSGMLVCRPDFDRPLPGALYNCKDIDDPALTGLDYAGVLVGDSWVTQVVCDLDEDAAEDPPSMEVYVFEYDDDYCWDKDDAIEVVEGEEAGDQVTFTVHFPDNDAQDFATCEIYTMAFVRDGEADSVKTVRVGHKVGVTCCDIPQSDPVDNPPQWTIYPPDVMKPVIYLYPEEETDIEVFIDFEGRLTCTYPEYDPEEGWRVTASPDGTLFDPSTGRTYDYLFWDGDADVIPDSFDRAACVAGEDTAAFLEAYLTAAGLNESEIDDFITFWLPKMECNAYNLISFPTEEYEEMAELNVSPAPDTVIRVYMVFTSLDAPVEIEEDHELIFPSDVVRSGYTLVEWGGSEV